jgi:hypothetical protein
LINPEAILQQLGLLGVFIAGAIPWLEAVGVIPIGILFGLNPLWTITLAFSGNAITTFAFAYSSQAVMNRMKKRGKVEGKNMARARRVFSRYGIWGMAFAGPLLIGSQIAAALSVALGVSAFKSAMVINTGMVVAGTIIGVLTALAVS